jgi:hypothetical protein
LERLGFGLLTLAVLVAEKKLDRNHIPLQKNIFRVDGIMTRRI